MQRSRHWGWTEVRYWIWTFGEIDGYRWVIDKKRMAFSEKQMRGKALNMAPGDKAVLYISRGAYHNPTRDRTRLAGVVEVKEAPRKAKAVEIAGREFGFFVPFEEEVLLPEMEGPEVLPLVGRLERVKRPEVWGHYFRTSPILLSRKDFGLLAGAITKAVESSR